MRAVCLMLAFFGLLLLGGCGDIEWFPDPPQVSAFTFSPASVDGVPTASVQTSAPVTIAMTTPSAAITVTGGEYSVNGAAFGSAAGTVVNGAQVTVRHTAAATAGGTVTTTLTIGGKSATFSSTTVGGAAPFSFTPAAALNVTPGSTQTSAVASFTVTGSSSISVTGGEYALDGGGFTTQAGAITSGAHQVQLRHTAADNVSGTTVTTTVTIGGTSASFTSATGNVAEAVVETSSVADGFAKGQVALQLVPGTYFLEPVEGFVEYSFDGVVYDVAADFYTFTAGQVLYLQDLPSPTPGEVVRSVILIDGVPIVFNARSAPL